ncbi:hypothetical protein DFA_07268 [Cavenderia fasciculata]|uniref:Nudix hydrolase domain-containing protein n=1 Tax=Cavenderia fasciculata TaxID=261658 RepID=F4PVY4_CACFS|nr:uncharacterized protein DFA_07268 [Cavenderia fasciculata]EGG20148.1 hypothetical protein DFA_07268 [Cavenderia fasciculata]|eukprot:XP_004367131.1 hypothetical protein DFA_07268 [Cavenderia fasciculata]
MAKDQSGTIPIRIKKIKLQDENGDVSGRLQVCGQFQMLMITNSSTGSERVFPKGSVKKSESLKKAAKRETMEECGIKGKILNREPPIVVTDTSKGSIIHYYPMLVTKKKKEWDEMDKRQRIWVPLDQCLSQSDQLQFKPYIHQAILSLARFISTIPSCTNINVQTPMNPDEWKQTKKMVEKYLLFDPTKQQKKQQKKDKQDQEDNSNKQSSSNESGGIIVSPTTA